jgi:hypothetical protein
MEIQANDHPIVRPEHFIDIETGIRKAAGNVLMVVLGALEASARRLVTVIDIIIGNDLIQDSGVLVVVSIVKTLNGVEIRFLGAVRTGRCEMAPLKILLPTRCICI